MHSLVSENFNVEISTVLSRCHEQSMHSLVSENFNVEISTVLSRCHEQSFHPLGHPLEAQRRPKPIPLLLQGY
jgi:hypothetical protein